RRSRGHAREHARRSWPRGEPCALLIRAVDGWSGPPVGGPVLSTEPLPFHCSGEVAGEPSASGRRVAVACRGIVRAAHGAVLVLSSIRGSASVRAATLAGTDAGAENEPHGTEPPRRPHIQPEDKLP